MDNEVTFAAIAGVSVALVVGVGKVVCVLDLSAVFSIDNTANIVSKMPAVAGNKKGKKTAFAKADDAVEEVKDSQVRHVIDGSLVVA